MGGDNRVKRRGFRFVAVSMVAFILGTLFSFVEPLETPTAWAGNGGVCDADGGTAYNGLKVSPSHGEVFYIDTGQGQEVNAAYVGYRVENTSGSTKQNLWVKLSSFSGGVVKLANPLDAKYRVGDVAGSETGASFFLLEANVATATDQSHVVSVYDRDPDLAGASSVYSCTFVFSEVRETIKAAANKVTDVSSTKVERLGGTLTITVQGQSGVIGSGTSSPDGEVMWFSPAARSSWPSSSLKLESTRILINKNPINANNPSADNDVSNTLVFRNPRTTLVGTNAKYYYLATYVFRIRGPVLGTVQALPIAQISSGTQIKHTDMSGITGDAGSRFTLSSSVNLTVSKDASTTVSGSDGSKEFAYTVTLTNGSADSLVLDQVVDDPSADLTFKASSAQFNSTSLADPIADSSGNLVFQGPFTIPGNSSRTITYSMVSTCTSGSFTYSNSAWGLIGNQKVGSSSTAVSGVSLTGSCPPSSVSKTATTTSLDPKAITQPASSVTSTTATINGSVNPSGTANRTILFEYGTDPTLATSTTTTSQNSNSSTSYDSVNAALSSLTAGTTYYFRVKIDSVYGEILSFTTPSVAADPTVTTEAVTSITAGTGSNGTAVLNGFFDANLTSSTPYFTWVKADNNGDSNTCTGVTYPAAQPVKELDDNGVATSTNVTLVGAFPSAQELQISGLEINKYYCAKAVIKWGASSSAEGTAVVFRVTETAVVTYNRNTNTGGSAPASGTGYVGSTYTVASNDGNLVKDGWTFSGWNTAANGSGTTYAAGSGQFSLTGATTLYAYWTARVTYNANGGSGAPTDSTVYETPDSATILSDSGMTNGSSAFVEWNTASDGSGTSYDPADVVVMATTGNLALFAIWAPSYTITYDDNNGTGGPADSSHPGGVSITISATEPTRTGYRFVQWQNGGANYAPGGAITLSGNVTLTAQWIQTFNVSYSLNGGSGTFTTTTHDTGSNAGISASTPIRANYRFTGWRDQDGNTYAESGSISTISKDITLTAQWVARYTVTYNSNSATSGSVPSATTHDSGATFNLESNSGTLARTDFTFDGWNTLADGSGTRYGEGASFTNITANQTLYALWYATLTYDVNTGSGTAPSDNTKYRPSNPATVAAGTGLSKTGYTFGGWNTAANGSGTDYVASSSLTMLGNTTLYAQWDPITYSITYDRNGGTGTAPSTQTLSYNGTVTLSSKPSGMNKSGFNFGGWNTQSDGRGTTLAAGSNYSTNSALALYARWVANVTYNSNSATSGTVPTDNADYLAGATVTVSSNSGTLARTGFTFDGWNTAADGSGTDYADTGSVQFTITENTTLYAQWASAAYTITYNGNSPTTGSAPGNQTASGGASITVPGNTGNLEKTGLLFGGWNTQSNGSGTTYPVGTTFAPPGNMTLYALWLTPYTVTYDPNGATGGSAPSNQTWGNGQTATVASNSGTLVRSGFLFGGWQTTTTGGTTYTAGSGTFTVTGNVTLYARWVTYSPGNSGGSSGGGKKTSPAVTPTPPVLVTPRVVPTRPVVPAPQAGPQAPPTPGVTPPGQNTPGNGNAPGSTTPTPPQPPQQSLAAPRSLLLNPGQGTVDLGGGIQPADEVAQGNPGNSGNQGNGGNGGNAGNPGSTGNLQDASPAGVPSLESARRTISELAGEQLGGFAPGSSTYIEIIGARTGARFVVTETEAVDSFALVRAMQTSIDAQRSDFFSIDTVQVANAPITPQPWTPEARDAANYLFTSSGLPEPTLLADLPVEQYTNWVFVETQADTYVPGSTVYLTLTSEPIVLAEAVVDRDGEVQISGTLPAELLTAGEHRVRIVGIRALDGASVGDDGEIVVSDALLEEIQHFDLGTQSTIAFFGSNPTGETHTALRVIPLVPLAPWWTLIFIGLGLILFGILRRWGPVRKRSQHTVAAIVVLSLASPAVIIGWLSTVTTVTWWGLGLGLIATVLYWFVRPKHPSGTQEQAA